MERREFLKLSAGIGGAFCLGQLPLFNLEDDAKTELTHYTIKGKYKSGAASKLGFTEVAKGEIELRVKEDSQYYAIRMESWPKLDLTRLYYKDSYFIRSWGKLEGKLFVPREYHLKAVEDSIMAADLYTYSDYWYDYDKGKATTEFYQMINNEGEKKHYGKHSAPGLTKEVKDYLSALMELRLSVPKSRKIVSPYNETTKTLEVQYLGKDTVKINKEKYDCLSYYLELNEDYVGKDAPYKIWFYIHDSQSRTPLKIFWEKKEIEAKILCTETKKELEERKSLLPLA